MIDSSALASAYERIDNRIHDLSIARDLSELIGELRINITFTNDPGFVKRQIKLAKALYHARIISKEEFVFYAIFPVENIFDYNLLIQDSEIIRINEAIDDVRRQHGLESDEWWSAGDGPPEYKKLNKEWDAVSDSLFLKALYEFELSEFAELFQENEKELGRLRERGRRAVFHNDDLVLKLRDIVVRYEEDAKRAATAKAYSAAVVSLGAG